MRPTRLWLTVCVAMSALAAGLSAPTRLDGPATVSGYVSLLLVNETPFPGERGWVSEQDTKAGMLAILWVLESRLKHVPAGYRQEHVASERCDDVIDVITAGGEKGQCDGFYRDASGRFVTVDRVRERVGYLERCASKGEPGRFARLLDYAARLARAYVEGGIAEADRFSGLREVAGVPVTGRAYSWMTDRNNYAPGGGFVRIPDDQQGSLGGNRFFTLRRKN